MLFLGILCIWAFILPGTMSHYVRNDPDYLEHDQLIGSPEDDHRCAFILDINNKFSEYDLKRVSIGTINHCFIVTTPNSKVVARISRDEKNEHELSDRSKERKLLHVITERGAGVKLLAVFANGHITQYVEGGHLEVKHMKEHYVDIAKVLSDLHSIQLSEEEKVEFDVSVWDRMDEWLKRAKKDLSKDDYKFFKKEVKELKDVLTTKEYNDKVLIHGDVNHGNIIYNKEEGTYTLVDYEFSGYGERYFDLANHFCEYAGLDLNWEYYPSVAHQIKFLSVYVRHTFGPKLGACEVKLLQRKVNKYSLVSHVFWALWGKLMHVYRPDDPFYEPYSNKRIERYLEVKERILSEPLFQCKLHSDL